MKSDSSFCVFLVDDDPFFLHICEQYLRNFGLTNITAFESSAIFLNNLERQPDLILLDYQLDFVDGIETLKKIKRFNPDSLVVFISGQENIEVAVNALKYGAFDYVVKHKITEEKLKVVVDKAIAITELLIIKNKKKIIRRLLPFAGLSMLAFFAHKFFSKPS